MQFSWILFCLWSFEHRTNNYKLIRYPFWFPYSAFVVNVSLVRETDYRFVAQAKRITTVYQYCHITPNLQIRLPNRNKCEVLGD